VSIKAAALCRVLPLRQRESAQEAPAPAFLVSYSGQKMGLS